MNSEKQEAPRVSNNGLWIFLNEHFFFHTKKCLIKMADLSIESPLFPPNIKYWVFMNMLSWHVNSNKPRRKHSMRGIPTGPEIHIAMMW